MSKQRIIFATKTGHSRKIAEAMGRALNLPVNNIKDHPDLHDVEILFIVGGIYGGESLPQLLTFIKEIEGENVAAAALVTSCASNKQRQEEVRRILEEKKIKVVREFVCPGSFLFLRFRRPNQTDIKAAITFAQQIIDQRGK